MFDTLKQRARKNENILSHCNFGPILVELKTDKNSYILKIDSNGTKLAYNNPYQEADFSLKATDAAWCELQKKIPRPGFQCLSTMRRSQHLTVSGDMIKFNQHLLLLEMLFSNIADTNTEQKVTKFPMIEDIHGRYVNMLLKGRTHRIYFEEAGTGVPLICLHTAGSDGRQYRHLLNDTAITKKFRIIAFDMPWHGKSSPPAGFEAEIYELTTDYYISTIISFIEAIGVEKPVVMGCSIGGRVILHLVLQHDSKLRGVIGLQSALFAEDRSLGAPNPINLLHRPDVHGGNISGALMAGMTAPQSPRNERWETMWHYMQSGPGVFMGDLHYYFSEGDLRSVGAEALKNSRCPIYLLNGEYDVSASPEMGRDLAELINAKYFRVMKNMGHFPMSENPDEFRCYLIPILNKVLGNTDDFIHP